MKIINLNCGVKNYMKVESHSAVIDAPFAVAKRKTERIWAYRCNTHTN